MWEIEHIRRPPSRTRGGADHPRDVLYRYGTIYILTPIAWS